MSLTEAPYTGSIQSTYNYIFSSSPNDLIYDVQPYCVNMGWKKIADGVYEGASNANEGYSQIQNSQYCSELPDDMFTDDSLTYRNIINQNMRSSIQTLNASSHLKNNRKEWVFNEKKILKYL
uniref:Uncharacterized protein n=1 Tax=Strongyloides papillosus TaxID=174720 RepID=A0A0N5B432_STREA